MQNSCNRESYALTLREEMSSFLSKKCVPVIKKRTMITILPERFFKNVSLPISESSAQSAMKYVKKERPAQRYYSLMIRLLESSDSFSMVVRNDNTDVLRISLINMTVYEIYLFALGRPANFPINQILVLGDHMEQFIPTEKKDTVSSYCYELAVPARTEREEYRQRIKNDLNKHFGIEVTLERLTIVKDSRKVLSIAGESLELIWEEQLMMIMKAKGVVMENEELTLEKH